MAWSRDGWWMVIPTEVDRLLGPVDIFGSHAGFGKVDFPCEFLHLPLGWVRLVDHRHVPARRRECFGCTMLDLKILLRWRWKVVLLLLLRRLQHLVMLLLHRLMHWLLVGICGCIAVQYFWSSRNCLQSRSRWDDFFVLSCGSK